MANLRSAIVGLGLGLGLAAAVVGCGGDKAASSGGAGTGSSAGSGGTAVAALAMPALGVDAVKRLNYEYGPGAKEAKALATAYAAKPRDWAAVRAAAEATLAKDPDHLDARWRLGEALANTGQPAQANAALAAVLAADWLGRGPGLETTPTLTAHLATPDGAALRALAGQLRDAVATHVAGSPWVLARRSGWKQPAPGTSYAATRGELYAVDPIAKRFVRLTHTDHSVAAYLRAPSGEVLLAGFTQAEVPDPAKAAKTAAPILTRAWLRTWNPADPAAPGVKATLGKARYAWVGYGKGEQLVVVTAPAAGRWAPGPQQGFVVDRGTGKLTKGPVVPFEGPAIELSLEDVRVGGDASFPAEDVLAARGPRSAHRRGRRRRSRPAQAGQRRAVAGRSPPGLRVGHRSVRQGRRRRPALALRRRRQDRRVQARLDRVQPVRAALARRRSPALRGRLGGAPALRRRRRARAGQADRARRPGPARADPDRRAAVPERADRRRSQRHRRRARARRSAGQRSRGAVDRGDQRPRRSATAAGQVAQGRADRRRQRRHRLAAGLGQDDPVARGRVDRGPPAQMGHGGASGQVQRRRRDQRHDLRLERPAVAAQHHDRGRLGHHADHRAVDRDRQPAGGRRRGGRDRPAGVVEVDVDRQAHRLRARAKADHRALGKT
jgi:hypothetical protein